MRSKMEDMYNLPRIRSCCEINDKNDIEFEKIVKFLNAQKAALDYAGLN
jgi:hypothetical protein